MAVMGSKKIINNNSGQFASQLHQESAQIHLNCYYQGSYTITAISWPPPLTFLHWNS